MFVEIWTMFAFVLSLILIFAIGIGIRSILGNLLAYRLIDTLFISIICFIIIGRILGIIFFNEAFVGLGWSILPISEEGAGQIVFFQRWPWAFLRVLDGNFLFLEPISSLWLADILTSYFHRQKHEISKKVRYYQYLYLGFSLVYIPFLIFFSINGYLSGVFNISWSIFFGLILVATFIYSFIGARGVRSAFIYPAIISVLSIFYINYANPEILGQKIIAFIVFYAITLLSIVIRITGFVESSE